MTTVSCGIDALRASMGGVVVGPDDPDYDDARRVWNGNIDRRPAVIARCASPADVAAAIGYGRSEGLEIAVRGGAHSMSGSSVVDGGLVVDLSPLRQVTVDPAAKRAASAVAPCWPTSTWPRRSTGWPSPPASSGTRGSRA